jgi:2-oxoisovalerate dehydrogenase E1 component beta subunit
MPGSPQDAAGLLISSIRDNNPVLYLENKYLYRRLRSDGPINLDPFRWVRPTWFGRAATSH